ncbi:MAG TPA: TetR/AcrR family transcriptional regulator [Rhodanobacteraceae bacterium]|nr:TetR/AcrR family transcriptional regulator [Rhodanobacteraceae bacterium]
MPRTPAKASTRDRILVTAEQLFAERGFAGASLRRVTSAAGVNLAAVNYHFGSKESLIEEIFRLRLDALTARRLEALDAVAGAPGTQLEDVLAAFIRPALDLSLAQGGGAFVRLLARAYADQDEHFRAFLSTNYGHVVKRFAAEFARLLPELPTEELFWRLGMISGALTYAMADFGMTRSKRFDSRAHREHLADHLIDFGAAGLRAPAP